MRSRCRWPCRWARRRSGRSWSDLPVSVRSRVQDRLGSEVVSAVVPGQRLHTRGSPPGCGWPTAAGFSSRPPSSEFSWMLACYRDEAVKSRSDPRGRACPRVRLVIDEPADGREWLVLVFDDIDGHPPDRPWRLARRGSALRTATVLSQALTPAPAGDEWAEVLDELPGGSTYLADDRPSARMGRPYRRTRRPLRPQPGPAGGQTLAHLDLRDDNLIIDADGTAWVCDWNFPALGPLWLDAVCLAISMYGDGLDVDALLAETGLVGPADAEAVDCLLAVLTALLPDAGRPARQPDLALPARSPGLVRHRHRPLAAGPARLALTATSGRHRIEHTFSQR